MGGDAPRERLAGGGLAARDRQQAHRGGSAWTNADKFSNRKCLLQFKNLRFCSFVLIYITK
jgi:hypothetical protein